jgi:hypothetical protein
VKNAAAVPEEGSLIICAQKTQTQADTKIPEMRDLTCILLKNAAAVPAAGSLFLGSKTLPQQKQKISKTWISHPRKNANLIIGNPDKQEWIVML